MHERFCTGCKSLKVHEVRAHVSLPGVSCEERMARFGQMLSESSSKWTDRSFAASAAQSVEAVEVVEAALDKPEPHC